MFSFFTKKDFLVDYLEGFIDIHNHILPGIDDGAKTVEDSIDLIKGFSEIGVKDFICTPHIMHNYYDNTPKTIKKSYKKLKKILKENGFEDVNINYAAEHMVDDNFEKILDNNKTLGLNKNHLLIEMSYLQPSINFNSAVTKIKSRGIFPVFAHPERYQYLNNDYNNYQKYIAMGLKFQLNMLSLGGYYGSYAKNMALKLLEKGDFVFIASDIHNVRQLNALKQTRINKQTLKGILVLIENAKIIF